MNITFFADQICKICVSSKFFVSEPHTYVEQLPITVRQHIINVKQIIVIQIFILQKLRNGGMTMSDTIGYVPVLIPTHFPTDGAS